MSAHGFSVGRGARPLQPTLLAEQPLPTSLICPERERELQEKGDCLGVKACSPFLQQGHRNRNAFHVYIISKEPMAPF